MVFDGVRPWQRGEWRLLEVELLRDSFGCLVFYAVFLSLNLFLKCIALFRYKNTDLQSVDFWVRLFGVGTEVRVDFLRLAGESASQKARACRKEKENCGKQKREADGQQEEVFMQISGCVQIFGGERLCGETENAAKQKYCADMRDMRFHPSFCCYIHNYVPFYKQCKIFHCLNSIHDWTKGIQKESVKIF